MAAAERSVDLAMLQYQEGLSNYQRVLDTQRFQVQIQDLHTAMRGAVATHLVALYKALGGGWQIRKGKDFVPEAVKKAMEERTNWGKLLSTEPPAPVKVDADAEAWRGPDW
jgi:hypothetical protein